MRMLGPISNSLGQILAAGLISGCAMVPPSNADRALAFMDSSLGATSAEKSSLWESLDHRDDDEAKWRRALLMSIPDHAAYAPEAALSALRAIADADRPPGVAPLARLRIDALKCRAEIDELQRRLDAVADIERELDGNRR